MPGLTCTGPLDSMSRPHVILITMQKGVFALRARPTQRECCANPIARHRRSERRGDRYFSRSGHNVRAVALPGGRSAGDDESALPSTAVMAENAQRSHYSRQSRLVARPDADSIQHFVTLRIFRYALDHLTCGLCAGMGTLAAPWSTCQTHRSSCWGATSSPVRGSSAAKLWGQGEL